MFFSEFEWKHWLRITNNSWKKNVEFNISNCLRYSMINCFWTFWWRPSRNRILESSLATYFYLIKYIWVAWKPLSLLTKSFWNFIMSHIWSIQTPFFSVLFSWVGGLIESIFLYHLIHSSIKDKRCHFAKETTHFLLQC